MSPNGFRSSRQNELRHQPQQQEQQPSRWKANHEQRNLDDNIRNVHNNSDTPASKIINTMKRKWRDTSGQFSATSSSLSSSSPPARKPMIVKWICIILLLVIGNVAFFSSIEQWKLFFAYHRQQHHQQQRLENSDSGISLLFMGQQDEPRQENQPQQQPQETNTTEKEKDGVDVESAPKPKRRRLTALDLPTVFLAGVPKAGTSAVMNYFAQQYADTFCFAQPRPGLPHTEKEPHFFDEYQKTKDRLDPSYYIGLFQHCKLRRPNNSTTPTTAPTTVLMDATPDYFAFPRQIYEFYQNHGGIQLVKSVKIIIILREPMSRELSWYHHRVYDAWKAMSKNETIPSYTHEIFAKENNNSSSSSSSSNNNNVESSENNSNGKIQASLEEQQQQRPAPPVPSPNSRIQTFTELWNTVLLRQFAAGMKRRRNMSIYVWYLQLWFHFFDHKTQILVVNYDELKNNQAAFLQKLTSFLNLPDKTITTSGTTTTETETLSNQISTDNNTASQNDNSSSSSSPLQRSNEKHMPNEDVPSCSQQQAMFDYFEPYNQKLYKLLEKSPGPVGLETKPFPKFQFECRQPRQ